MSLGRLRSTPDPKGKGRALLNQLRHAGVEPGECAFDVIAVGPIFPEQLSLADHLPYRNRMGWLEWQVADRLRQRGYRVLGEHRRAGVVDDDLLRQVWEVLDSRFPRLVSGKDTF